MDNKGSSKWFDKGDIVTVVLALLSAWFFGGKTPATTGGSEDQKQKIISAFGAFFSKVDEGMWQSLIVWLKESWQKRALISLLKTFDKVGEVDSFRMTVVNAPCGCEKSKEYSTDDLRVKFLIDIVNLVEDPDWGPKEVCDMLRTHKLATENKIARHALDFWKGALAFGTERVCGFFKVDKFSDITFHMIMKELNLADDKGAGYINLLTDRTEDLRRKRRGRLESEECNWRNVWGFGWGRAGGVITVTIGIILVIAASIHNS